MESLSSYSIKELEAEIKRRKTERVKSAAGRCESCGEYWYFEGYFSAWQFEIQVRRFQDKHKDCLPIFNGGYI